ncbi:universal stress protein [Actinosynnema sp. NPDC004786]
MRRVLVATDFSEGSRAALRRAFAIAGRHGVDVTVVHAAPPGLGVELVEAASRALRDLVRDAAVPVEAVVATGSVGPEVVAEAERREAGLVVVGARGAHRPRDLFPGSTAEQVVELSPVPVLVVKRAGGSAYSSALCAVDATSRSFRAARSGIALTRGTPYLLLHGVTVLGENLLRLTGADDRAIRELRRGQLAVARPEVERLAAGLTPAPAEVLVEAGRPEDLVPDLADRRGADLVVVGVERGSGLRHALIGSVSRHALREAPCDVLVVPLT